MGLDKLRETAEQVAELGESLGRKERDLQAKVCMTISAVVFAFRSFVRPLVWGVAAPGWFRAAERAEPWFCRSPPACFGFVLASAFRPLVWGIASLIGLVDRST